MRYRRFMAIIGAHFEVLLTDLRMGSKIACQICYELHAPEFFTNRYLRILLGIS